MVTKFSPEPGKVYFNNEFCLYHVLSGQGTIEVDFKHYADWDDKILFLNKGQYIKFYSDDFVIRKITFTDEQVFKNQEFRVLFKHLISLGYISFSDCKDCQAYLKQTVFSVNTKSLIDVSSEQWYWQNPFNANKDEYHVIFDVKDVIDAEFQNHLTSEDITAILKENGREAMTMVKDKVGVTIRNLLQEKRLLESRKALAFTDKSVKEIAYSVGYKDPSYFIRVFNKFSGKNPLDFRRDFGFDNQDQFIQDILELIKTHHAQNRTLDFYAEQLHMSVKTLSRKVSAQMNNSLGQLVRNEVLQTAKSMLHQQLPISEISYRLSFEEPNHFSAFFKHYTGLSPTAYQTKKYNA